MGGNTLSLVGDALDVATAFVAPEFLPLVVAGTDFAEGEIQGKGFGKSLTSGLEGGAEALAGQEVAGAFGVGSGNSAFNNALGITDTPGSFGLPDVGGALQNGFNSATDSVSNALGFGGSAADAATGTDAGSVGSATTSTGAPTTASPISSAPVSGAVTSASAAPAESAAAVGSQLSPGSIADTATGETPGLGGLFDAGAPGVAGTPIGSIPDVSAAPASFPDPTSATGPVASASPLGGVDPAAVNASLSGAAPSSSSVAPAASDSNSLFSKGNLLKAAVPLGELGYEAIKGSPALPASSQALGIGGSATAPLLAEEQAGLNEGTTGQLSPGEQANVLQYVQGQQNALIQQLASQGVTDIQNDSRYIGGLAQIQQQALALQQQYITAAIQSGVSAGGAAASNLATVANQQLTEDKEFQDSLTAAFSALGGAFGNQSGVTVNLGK